MANIPHALDAFYSGEVVAWVDVVTSPQGRLRNATLNVRPGFIANWFVVDQDGVRYEGSLSCPPDAAADLVQSWNTNDAGITEYSAGIGAERYAGT